jgi:hypothetical protein
MDTIYEIIVCRLYRGFEGVIQDNVKSMFLVVFSFFLNLFFKDGGVLTQLFKHMFKKITHFIGIEEGILPRFMTRFLERISPGFSKPTTATTPKAGEMGTLITTSSSSNHLDLPQLSLPPPPPSHQMEKFVSYDAPTSPHHAILDKFTPSILNHRAHYSIEEAIALEQFAVSERKLAEAAAAEARSTNMQKGLKREVS